MLISTSKLAEMPEFKGVNFDVLEVKIRAIEQKIRAYTHNNFQNRSFRFYAQVVDGCLNSVFSYLKNDDTIQISENGLNAGVYTVLNVENDIISLDKKLIDCDKVLVTKVEYPEDVIAGAIEMLKYDINRRGKEGIQSETISRHSVTYFDVSEANQAIGYPISLVSFLRPYMKARF